MFRCLTYFSLILATAALPARETPLVVSTEALPPSEQQTKFHLPPGFEIQLVAAEPVINQPINIRFDAAGRLWVTSTVEYPYPADGPGVEPRGENFTGTDTDHAPRDTVTILSDFAPSGKARTVTKFIRGLNLPYGILPLPDGAIIYSIPAIKRYTDTDGDNHADKSTTLITGFGNVDTHGMTNGFRLAFDGWIYACHGFRNTSHLEGTDGSKLDLNSGNIYRFRPDGTNLQQFTRGQVNPFGLTFDPRGDLYSADCHSMPLTCLLRGAYYPSFGKPHGGLGFAPTMIDHNHGSTGICGPAFYAAEHFPPDFRQTLYLCNPVSGVVHRDRITWTGSSPHANTKADFITCEDGWFRPVDVAVGPDGALYIADFYNAVIGHYEVPLDHPKRDRTNGRIWRVVYVGEDSKEPNELRDPPNLNQVGLEDLVRFLGDPNLTIRLLATNELVHRASKQTSELLDPIIAGNAAGKLTGQKPAAQRAHALWVLFRLDRLRPEQLDILASDDSPLVRVHTARVLEERRSWSGHEHALAITLLADSDPFVRRATARALGQRGGQADLHPLLELFAATPQSDTHLRHAIRIALKLILSRESELAFITPKSFSREDRRVLAGVLLAVDTKAGAQLLARFLRRDLKSTEDVIPNTDRPKSLAHVFQVGPSATGDAMVALLREGNSLSLEQKLNLIKAARAARLRRGAPAGKALLNWAEELAGELLDLAVKSAGWSQWGTAAKPTFAPKQYKAADGRTSLYWSSIPNGEQLTGTLRSQTFSLPESFTFYLAGHSGVPPKKAHHKNIVRLRAADSGAILRTAYPPRNDTPQLIKWKFTQKTGTKVYLEATDGDTGSAYAWLAAGRFNIPELDVTHAVAPAKAADLIKTFSLADLRPRLINLLNTSDLSPAARAAIAGAIAKMDQKPILAALAPLLGDPLLPESIAGTITSLATEPNTPSKKTNDLLADVFGNLSSAGQRELAKRLSATVPGSESLLFAIEQGRASARLLTQIGLRMRLAAHKQEEWKPRIAKLTDALPPVEESTKKLIKQRVSSFDPTNAEAKHGAVLFKDNCANCHRIGAEGSLVGPQLDGIGIRGVGRLAEDILDPNRNVDGAFRTTTIVTNDGRVLAGLVRHETNGTLILADNEGKEFTVPLDTITERVPSPLSLMPANMSEVLQPQDFADLMAFLLEQRKPTEKTPTPNP